MTPRIAFAGAGSIGSMVGGLMARAGHDVTLVDQWPEHVDAMKHKGLRLSGTVGDHVVPVNALHIHELQSVPAPFDVVFVTVKSYDTEWMATLLRRYAAPDARFVSLQNAINEERLAGVVGREWTLGCVTTISTGLYEPGHSVRTDALTSGVYRTGELDGSDTPRAREIVDLLAAAGTSLFTSNLMGERWAKLAGNCSTNALVGITGYGTVETIRDAACRRIGARAAAEAIRVARGAGYEVEDVMGIPAQDYIDAQEGRNVEELEAKMLAYTDKTKNTGVASFGQDVLKGRWPEIDFLNGYVSEKGRELGIETPVCDALVELIHSQRPGQFKPDPSLVQALYKRLL